MLYMWMKDFLCSTVYWIECLFSTHDCVLSFICRSDIGSEVGFEATGVIDAKLPTIGVWAKKSDEVLLV